MNKMQVTMHPTATTHDNSLCIKEDSQEAKKKQRHPNNNSNPRGLASNINTKAQSTRNFGARKFPNAHTFPKHTHTHNNISALKPTADHSFSHPPERPTRPRGLFVSRGGREIGAHQRA